MAELFVQGSLDVIVHAGAQTTAATVQLAEHAASIGAAGVAVIGPPYFQLDERALLTHFSAAARACAPLPFYVYEFERASGYAVPLPVLERLGEEAPNLAGLKVSDTPYEGFARYLGIGLDVFVGPEAFIARGSRGRGSRRRVGARDRLPGARRRGRSAAGGHPAGDRALPAPCSAEARPPAARRFDQRGRARAAAAADRRRATGARRMAGRIVVAGAGAVGASIAYHLALLGARGVVLADRARDRLGGHREGDGRRSPAVFDARGGGARARERPALPRARRAAVRGGRVPLRGDDRRRE